MGKIRTANKRRFNRRRSKKIMKGGGGSEGGSEKKPSPTSKFKRTGAFRKKVLSGKVDTEVEFKTHFTDILKKMDDEFIIPATLSYNLDPKEVALCDYEEKDSGGKDSGEPKEYGSAETNLKNIAITTEKLATWNKCLEPAAPSSDPNPPGKLLILADAHGGIIPEQKFTIPDNIVLCLLTRLGQYGYTNTADRGQEFLSLSDRNSEYYETLFRDKIKRTTDMGMDVFYSYDNDNFIKNDCFANSSWYYPGQTCDDMSIGFGFEKETLFRPFGIYFINPKGESTAKDRQQFDLGNQPPNKYAEGTKLYYDKKYFRTTDQTLSNITNHFNVRFGKKPISGANASILLVVHCCRKIGKETNKPFLNDFYTQVINNYLIDNNVREEDLKKEEVTGEIKGEVAESKTTQLTLSLPTHHLPISNVLKKYTLASTASAVKLDNVITNKINEYNGIKDQIGETGVVSFSSHESLKRIENVIDDLVSNFNTISSLKEFKIRFNKLVKHPLSRAEDIPDAYDKKVNETIEQFQTYLNDLTPLSDDIDKKIINSDIDKIATIKERINRLNIEEFAKPGDIHPIIKAISDLKITDKFVEIHSLISNIQEAIIHKAFRDKLRQNIIASAKALDDGKAGYVLIKNSIDIDNIEKEGVETKWVVSKANMKLNLTTFNFSDNTNTNSNNDGDGEKVVSLKTTKKIIKAFDSFGHPIGFGIDKDYSYSYTLKYHPEDVPKYEELFVEDYSLNADNLINSISNLDDSNFPVTLILDSGSEITEQENNMKARLRQKIDNHISLLEQQKEEQQLGNINELKNIYAKIKHNYKALRELQESQEPPVQEDEDIKNEIEYLNPDTLYFIRDYEKEKGLIFALNNLSKIIETQILNYVDNTKYLKIDLDELDRINEKYITESNLKKKISEELSRPYFVCLSNSTFIYLAKQKDTTNDKYSDIYNSYNPLCNVFTLKIYEFIKKIENLELEYDNIENLVLNKLKTSSLGKFSILCYYFYNKSYQFERIFNIILKYKTFDKTFDELNNKLNSGFDEVFRLKKLKIPNEEIIKRPRFLNLIIACDKALGFILKAVNKIGPHFKSKEKTDEIDYIISKVNEIKSLIVTVTEPKNPVPIIRIKNITEYLNDFEFIVKNIKYIKSCIENPVNLDGIYKIIIYSKVFKTVKRHSPQFLNSTGILKNYARYYTKEQYKLNNPNSLLNHKLLQFVKMANLLNLDLESYGFKIETPEIAVITNKQSLDFYKKVADASKDPASGGKHIKNIHLNLEDTYDMEEIDFENLVELISNEHVYKLRIIGTTYPVLKANVFPSKENFNNIKELNLDNTFGVYFEEIKDIFPNITKLNDNRCLSEVTETDVFNYTHFKDLNNLEIKFTNKFAPTVNIKFNGYLKLISVDRTTNKITIDPGSIIEEIIIDESDINELEYKKDTLPFLKIINSSVKEIIGIVIFKNVELKRPSNLDELINNIFNKVINLKIIYYIARVYSTLLLKSFDKLKKIEINYSDILLKDINKDKLLTIEYHIKDDYLLEKMKDYINFETIGQVVLVLIGDKKVQDYYELRIRELEKKDVNIRDKIIYDPE